ncbi:MAG: diacylglycerol kinase family lipid kinase [Acholeplasmataceae bacterium]|nr:diacylglycerol kinase family lipid kinase [Acholeplasmataceae bacterium]
MRCIFIYNPKSGKGRIAKKADLIKRTLEKKYEVVDFYQTSSQKDTVRAAREACGKYDALIFSGGDGTFNDITCGVASESVRPVLGYIPSGTVNDIARNLRIPRNVKRALNIILDGDTVYHDVGRINDRYFMYVVGAGTFTGSSYRTKHDVKKIFGKLAYAFEGLKEALNPKLVHVKIKMPDREVDFESPLVLVINSVSVAGIPFFKQGHLNDGSFDIVVVKKGIYRGLFNVIRLFLLGLVGLRRKRIIDHFRCSSFSIETEGEPRWTVDGEAGPIGNIYIENIHNHLEIFIPRRRNMETKSKYFR